MIKPESLWTLCKSCPDSKWVGDILRALGGQTVELDFGQAQMLSAIQNDSQWMDERIEQNREKERQRKLAYRIKREEEKEPVSRDVPGTKRCPTMSRGQSGVPRCPRDKAVSHTIHPSILPSIHPSIQPTIHPSVSVCNISAPAPARTHARMDVPTAETVLLASAAVGVPDWYVKWWHAEMTARDWTKVDGSPVGNRNWRPVLKSWWNRDEKDAAHLQEIREKYEKKVVIPKVYKPEDWALCSERCTNYCNGCKKGMTVPPDKREPPCPPEECKEFNQKNEKED